MDEQIVANLSKHSSWAKMAKPSRNDYWWKNSCNTSNRSNPQTKSLRINVSIPTGSLDLFINIRNIPVLCIHLNLYMYIYLSLSDHLQIIRAIQINTTRPCSLWFLDVKLFFLFVVSKVVHLVNLQQLIELAFSITLGFGEGELVSCEKTVFLRRSCWLCKSCSV